MKKRLLINLIFPFVSLAVLFVIWGVAARTTDSELILPSPLSSAKRLGEVFGSREFYVSFWFTTKRTFMAFGISFVCAFLTAMITAVLPSSEGLFKPILYIIRCLPTMAVVLLFIIWTDSNITPVLVTVLVLFPMIYSSFAVSLKDVDKDLVETAKVFGASKMQMIKIVYVPQILPALVDAVASGISLGLKVVVSAEVLAQSFNSIGWLMQESRFMFDTAKLMALTIAVVAICMALEAIIRGLGKRLYSWR